jgi:heat shock protein HtpX
LKYIGLQQQIKTNNRKSVLLLLGFPFVILGAVYAFFYFVGFDAYGNAQPALALDRFVQFAPLVCGAILIWFLIAYFSHTQMIAMATGAKPLERKENLRVYNLVENLCISVGMKMPKVQVIESDALNAYASGIREKDFTVTLTQGIISTLNDEELEGVIAHELMHIRNKDVRLLVISVVFVGIFSFVSQLAFRNVIYGTSRSNKDTGKVIFLILIISTIAYFFTLLFRFSLSRSREYLADSGAAEMTRKPWALASALKKIATNHHVKVKSEDVQYLFIENTPKDNTVNFMGGLGGLFATHPPIEKRISFLEQV